MEINQECRQLRSGMSPGWCPSFVQSVSSGSCEAAPDKLTHNAAHPGFQWIPPQGSSSWEPEVTDDRYGLKTKELVLPLAHMLCARGSQQLSDSKEKIPLCKACLDA